jgi:hypothetical protein
MAPAASLPDAAAGGRRALWRVGLIGAALLATTLAGPVAHLRLGDLAFAALAVAQGLLVLLATRLAAGCRERQGLALILGVAVALRLALLPVPPHLSSDVYRYVWDGRVQGAGINPYRHVPEAPALEALRDEAVFPHINRRDYAVTIYPPAAQMLFALLNRVSDSVLAIRLALVACEAATVAVLVDLLRRLRIPATRVVAYAWHPLAVWEIAGSGHIDAAMVAATMLGLWFALVPGRRLLAASVLAVAALLKPFAALALSAAWQPREHRGDWQAPAVALATAALLYLPYLSVGAGVLGFLPTYFREEHIDTDQGFWLVTMLQYVTGPVAWAPPLYLATGAALIGGLALAVPLGRDQGLEARLRRLFWLFFAFVMLLSPNLPWYYMALLPFVALLGPAPGWAATICCFVLYDVVGADIEVDFAVRDTALNLVVLAALAAALRPHRAVPETKLVEVPR